MTQTPKTILVTGGAGYVGSVLIKKLLNQNFNIKIIDSLVYGSDGISNYFSNDSIEFINSDIREIQNTPSIFHDVDCIIHLAAVVGEPLCKKIPLAAKQINEFATKNLIKLSKKSGIKRFIFASTCSNYGSSENVVNENSPVSPLSLYSECKVNSEKFLLSEKSDSFQPCVLRFATAHGLSPRMRFDLLLQEFLRDALVDKKISIFGQDFWRPLIHVEDMADACISSINSTSELISGQIYNVGSDEENYTKKQLAEIIQSYVSDTEIEIIESKIDPRNYKVSFDKIKTSLNFTTKKSVTDSITEILQAIDSGVLNPRDSEFTNISKLTEQISTLNNYQFDENL
tara:strand:+ start:2250 stop:3278 length:1029 start_codon:yes stop_codon:yes gene_type:complete